MFLLENCINEILHEMSNSVQINAIYRKLRFDLIHAQICLAEFFKWRRRNKELADKQARTQFKMHLEETAEDLAKEQLERMNEHRKSSASWRSRGLAQMK